MTDKIDYKITPFKKNYPLNCAKRAIFDKIMKKHNTVFYCIDAH